MYVPVIFLVDTSQERTAGVFMAIFKGHYHQNIVATCYVGSNLY